MSSGKKFFVAIGLIACDLLLFMIFTGVYAELVDTNRRLHTDHVFHFSSAFEQELLDDPTFPDPALLGKQDDVIWEPSVQALWSPSGSSRTPTELGFKALGFIYTDHPIFNHGDFRLHVRQRVSQPVLSGCGTKPNPMCFCAPTSRAGQEDGQSGRSRHWRSSSSNEDCCVPLPHYAIERWASFQELIGDCLV